MNTIINTKTTICIPNEKFKDTVYVGPKGYTIYKNTITIEEQNHIKKELTVKPNQGFGGSICDANQKVYFAYRETLNKLYIPLYYGIHRYGKPEKNKLNNGIDLNKESVYFYGALRDMQTVVVDKFMNNIRNNDKYSFGGGLLELPCAFGKTVLALNIISQIKKKTLIIVHKEFLMNQWIERIRHFLPNSNIGKIQGQIIDIDNKDIVIGMLQSISMKDYPVSTFETFGFTIIDEVHHISSETFSKSLFKIVTKYTLGLSATMNRKDGTTKVFKMFLGDVVFKGKRDEERNVTVRAIEYITNDYEFNEVKTDFRGNPAYSSMISKICEYNRRSEFILKILSDMLIENPKQQFIILAHNKNILKYFHDAINHKKIATCGYYVGGMKELALKESETKQVVIATYAMAAEALDIKTLTTLIMATPKTDIQQSVGRILREKHSEPIVVDIIDTHDLFKNQWKKRKVFYKKEKYKIIYTTSQDYSSDINKDTWNTITYSKKSDTSDIEYKDKLLQGKCLLNHKTKK